MAGFDLQVTRILNVYHVRTSGWSRPSLICREASGLVYFDEGTITYSFEQGEMTASPGDVLVFPKGLRYSGEKKTEFNTFTVIDFDAEPEDGLAELNLPHVMKARERVGMLFRQADEAWNSGKIQSVLQCRSILYSILAELTGIQARGKRQSALLEEVLIYMSRHYTEPDLNIEAISDAFHISASQLRRIFLKEINVSPGQYVMKLRLELAQNLLRHEGVPVREAAIRSGFNSEFYFCRLFKSRFGMTPGEFKRSYGM